MKIAHPIAFALALTALLAAAGVPRSHATEGAAAAPAAQTAAKYLLHVNGMT